MKSDPHGVVFLRYFIQHQQEIYAYILTLVPNRHDADDLFQEALTVMWNKFERFEQGTNFVAWGIQISRFLVLEYRRRKASDREVQLSEEVLDALAQGMPAVQDRMVDRLEVLKECLSHLDDRAKRLVKMRYERNTPIRDMASSLELSIRQVQRTLASINGILLRCMRRGLSMGGDSL